MLNFRLKVFYSVAQHKNFTKAANELFITQPAVSKHIQELEKETGLRLLERNGNQTVLTPAGEILLKHTESLLNQYQQLDFELSALKDNVSGQLRLGASTTIAQYVLPPLLARFYQTFPDIRLSMLNDNSENIEAALIEHKIELGIVEGKTQNKALKYTHFMADELVAVVHSKSKLAKLDEITLADLSTIPLVLRESGSGTLEVIVHELKKHQVKISDLNVALYLGSPESIKAFLSHSNCMGFISIRAISNELAAGTFKVIDIKDFAIERSFDFVHLQGQTNGFADLFMRFAQSNYNILL